MREENYINILGKFLSRLLEAGKISVKDSVIIMKAFEPVCTSIKTRQDLIQFLDKYVGYYWELKELKHQLLDSNHKFE
jgi:hypothetical protein